MKYKFTFVVLHYITIEDTTECVDSILTNIKYDNYMTITGTNTLKDTWGDEDVFGDADKFDGWGDDI